MLERLFASRRHPYIPHRNEREKISIDLSGNRVKFFLPPHTCHDSFAEFKLNYPEKINIFDDSDYNDGSDCEDMEREGVARQCLMERSWELFGPIWRSRPIGTIDFNLILNRHDTLPHSMSCLNPKHFEQVVMRCLYYWGPGNPNDHVQKAPVNWKLYKLGEVTAIFLERHRLNSPEILTKNPHHETYFTSSFFIPLDRAHYLTLNFRYLGYAPAKHCLVAMNSIRDAVCNSVSLQLGIDIKKQLAEVQRQRPNDKASTKRKLEPWVYPEWHRGGEFDEDIIIIKPGSPPPDWLD
ncbi:hypothetical protein [Microbulbifer sp. TRSA005]|uniref:hypothetical protein n=1 Tax=unclassified Microbulbifer TaxID=2619833 RepID=UPI0040391C9F